MILINEANEIVLDVTTAFAAEDLLDLIDLDHDGDVAKSEMTHFLGNALLTNT